MKYKNSVIFEFANGEGGIQDNLRIEVPISSDAPAYEVIYAFKRFLEAVGYCDETIEKYIDTETAFEELYEYLN